MQLLSILCLALLFSAAPVLAQDDAAQDRRLELAARMLEIRPAREQVESAIEHYVARAPANQRDALRSSLRNALNYKALEKISLDAYAETYTVEELEAMVEYYGKPEARSASQKSGDYAKKVYPEIIRMLDKAMMKTRTGQ
ncbi:MAG: hypothetical protein K9G62_04165 [Alphaproteobacteria bacterium]|nr:hypothetical protein [Alphaproteobacteria bacterium]